MEDRPQRDAARVGRNGGAIPPDDCAFARLTTSGAMRFAYCTLRVPKSPEVVQFYVRLGNQAVGGSPEEFAAFIKVEHGKWSKVITETGITSE